MRLLFRLPAVKPDAFQVPQSCPYPGCKGKHFRLVQEVPKPLRDTQHREVTARRYRCLRCGHTFRVYPTGVCRDHFSQRVKGLAVALYLLGLSYGAVSLLLEALGLFMSKTLVYYTVQEAARKVPGLRRDKVIEGVRVPALGSDVTSVKVKGKWYPIGVAVDAVSGLVVCVEGLKGEDAPSLKEWLQPVAEAVGAELLVTDDADAFKQVADELGLFHQICKSHVQRNTEQLVEELQSLAKEDCDGSLRAIGVTAAQAVADLERLKELVQERQPEQGKELETMLERYLKASPPREGEKASVAYRIRLLLLDRWNLWGRLTRYRKWKGRKGEQIDGTNNAAERAIGWWVKERYRSMRGYKQKESAVNISRLLAWCGNHLTQGGAPLDLLLA
jgi:transposase-like protein